jgi:acetolactate synthase-1/2/3 large subunit
MSEGRTTVAAAILDVAFRNGVVRAFGIPGVHNLPFWDCDQGSSIVGVRHEQAAVYACDGLYRASGDLALALLTSGPGAANAVAAFGEAFVSGSPLVAIASEVGMAQRASGGPRGLLHEMADQTALFAAFGAPARTSRTRQEAMAGVVLALRDAQAATPAYVGIPTDVLAEEWTASIPHLPRMPAARVDENRLGSLAEVIGAAQRPVLWLGGGVVRAGANPDVTALAERIGAPVLTSFAGRGLMAGHPLLVDAPVHEPRVRRLVADSDLLVILGSDFDGMNTMNWRLPLPDRRVAITLGSQVERTVDLDVLVRADLAAALPGLLELLPAQTRTPWASVHGIRAEILAGLHADPRTRPAAVFVELVDASWPTDGVVVCDMAVAGYWYGGYSRQPRPRRLQYPVGWGTLGYALPAAIGPASLGLPTLAVCGDGGPMFALGELATYAQESLPVTLLVVDDGGYGMLRFDQQVFGHPERGVDLFVPDWSDLGRAFGIITERVEDVSALGGALTRAHTANLAGEPRIVVWPQRLHPPRTTSPRWHEPEQ